MGLLWSEWDEVEWFRGMRDKGDMAGGGVGDGMGMRCGGDDERRRGPQ